ncbi:hypothetical protein ACNKHV_06895 [Shigella flexneri]
MHYEPNWTAPVIAMLTSVKGLGEYATRGALLDLFPMGSELPYRLDFFDDESTACGV